MFLIFMTFLFALMTVIVPIIMERFTSWPRSFARLATAAMAALAVFFFASTSYVQVPRDYVGLLDKKLGASLRDGRIVATHGEAGPQARMLMPGLHVEPFINVVNHVDIVPMVRIPPGFYGRITANDGRPLDPGAFIAHPWPEKNTGDMLRAEVFLEGDADKAIPPGEKGVQLSVLPPGQYPLNLYLFTVEIGNGATRWVYDRDTTSPDGRQGQSALNTARVEIPGGSVGVVRSSILTRTDCPSNTTAQMIVPEGCRGIWDRVYVPGEYYLNRDAYSVTEIDTRLQTLEYKGGFVKRSVYLTVDQAGNITQRETSEPQQFDPTKHADRAVMVKVEGWDIPQEVRVVVEVNPQDAAKIVANVGDVRAIEDRVITPLIRSIVRNVMGGGMIEVTRDGQTTQRPVVVLDLIENRDAIEKKISEELAKNAKVEGVTIREFRLGEPAIPPELLVARQRQQLAGQLAVSFEQERLAQVQRQQTEQARATAEQQQSVVRAQIAANNAKLFEEQRAAEGRAERAFLEEQAKGQQAIANALGVDQTVNLRVAQMFFDLLKDKPELITGLRLPQVLVTGSGAGAENGSGLTAAILGSVAQALQQRNAAPAAPQK